MTLLDREIHKVSHQKEAVRIHWVLTVHRYLQTRFPVVLTGALGGQYQPHLIVLSLAQGLTAGHQQSQHSNPGLSWTKSRALLTPTWPTATLVTPGEGQRQPRWRKEHWIRVTNEWEPFANLSPLSYCDLCSCLSPTFSHQALCLLYTHTQTHTEYLDNAYEVPNSACTFFCILK